jgi:DNA-binding phage protein
MNRHFRQTVKARGDKNPDFCAGLCTEAVQAMLDGDFATGRIMLRHFINATVGFSGLAARVGGSEKSLMRMFGPTSSPRAENLVAVLRRSKTNAACL